jgi:hypothetical protein
MGHPCPMVDESLSRAVLAYIGTPGRIRDVTPEDHVIEDMGGAGLDLIPPVKSLVDELYEAKPPLWAADSVDAIGQRVGAWLRQHHPELSDEAIRAVANQYAFDWR